MSKATDLGRLIAFALDVTAAPGSSGEAAEHGRLVEQYLADAEFRLMVDDFAEGANCEVAHADERVGLILRSEPDGPWAWPRRSAELPWNKKFGNTGTDPAFERAARMIVIPALLAYIAPTAADVEDLVDDPTALLPEFTVNDLEQFIRDFARDRENSHPDPSGDEPPLWWHWLQISDHAPTTTRIARSISGYLVYDVLQCLQQIGLLAKVTGSGQTTTFRARRVLLFHYRDLLLNDLFEALQQHAQRNTSHARTASEE